MHFDELFLRKLCADKVSGDFPPFKSKNIDTVERYIKGIVGRLNDCKSLIVKADFTSYGSGFASYIPIQISKKDRSDTLIQKKGDLIIEDVNALELYLSNLSPYWYYGVSKWSRHYKQGANMGGSHGFLNIESYAKVDKQLWHKELEMIKNVMDEYRYMLLLPEEVEKSLWFEVKIRSNLGTKPYEVFDCFFHWED